MSFDIDAVLEKLRNFQYPTENELKKICNLVKSILIEESNIQPVSTPIVVCGDIHGQFPDLLELFRTGGELPKSRYIFMGDYVDRGYYSIEVWTILLLFKIKFPQHMVLLRGNHESRQITQVYGFYDECIRKYGNAKPWRYCCEVFDLLNLGALIDGRIFCVHGGLSPDLKTIDQSQIIQRNQEIPHEGAFCDMMWSDPEAIETWAISPRGAGWLFGYRVTKEFNQLNSIDLICRAHQLVQEGYKYMFDDMLTTVWSAPNYSGHLGNLASVLCIDEQLNRKFKIFKEVPVDRQLESIVKPMYFL